MHNNWYTYSSIADHIGATCVLTTLLVNTLGYAACVRTSTTRENRRNIAAWDAGRGHRGNGLARTFLEIQTRSMPMRASLYCREGVFVAQPEEVHLCALAVRGVQDLELCLNFAVIMA